MTPVVEYNQSTNSFHSADGRVWAEAQRYTVTMVEIDDLRNKANAVLELIREDVYFIDMSRPNLLMRKRLYNKILDEVGEKLVTYRKEHRI